MIIELIFKGFATPIYAESFEDIINQSNKIEASLNNAVTARDALEFAETIITNKKKCEKVTLLQGQPFNIRKEDKDYCVVMATDNLNFNKDGTVFAEKSGTYKTTLFYEDIGFFYYEFEIRESEKNVETNITAFVDYSFGIDLKNKDLATYETGNEDILSVTGDGVFTPYKAGSTSITAIINDYQRIDFQVDVVRNFPDYTQSELDLICAIVQQECATSYEGALAVISCAYNRSQTPQYAKFGDDPLSQLTLEGQFCYSIDSNWVKYLNGNVNDNVKKAVYDCLYTGKTNHNFLSFRGFVIENGVNFDGNYYFNPMN